ncbi:MAG: hypothetical protein Q7K36_00170 [Fusobacterium sp. JB020]|nr:hypothetical protein [Fusobacterium sp. JB020]
MFYINNDGLRFPKEIYDKLPDEQKKDFVSIKDEDYNNLVNKSNNENKEILVKNGQIILSERIVTKEDKLKNELNSLQSYMDSTDWISSKCYDLELKVKDEYPVEYEKRKSARLRIHEIKQILYG